MKKTIIKSAAVFAYCLLLTAYCIAQGTAINTTGAKADSSAMLDVSSTGKGILIPRMTKTQKLSISNPATGLIVFQTDDTTGLWYYDSSKWVQAMGQSGGGGAAPCLPQPEITTSSPHIVCLYGDLKLKATSAESGVTFSWYGPNAYYSSGTSDSITVNNMIDEKLGTYYVTVSKGGCTSSPALVSVQFPASQHGYQTFSHTGSPQTFTVPQCVTIITVQVWGAGSGGGMGQGGYSKGDISVTPGQQLAVVVGQAGKNDGTSAYPGGGIKSGSAYGGGGYSGIFGNNTVSFANSLVIAGGGGGWGNGGMGYAGYDGNGGGTSGNTGDFWNTQSYAGKGGSQTGGGAAGACYGGCCSTSGGQLSGGTGGSWGGGGGGSGYYGGGGGCYDGTKNTQGGGGSGYISGAGVSNATTQTGVYTGTNYPGAPIGQVGGNGFVYISW